MAFRRDVAAGGQRPRVLPVRFKQVLADFLAAMRGRLAHDDLRHYNAVQKLSYLFVIADSILIVSSGLVVWKSVQFPLLNTLFGGYDLARKIHFFAMAGLAGFILVHLILVVCVPRTLVAMIRGR
jgi:thiosulfate reductase cytochrome b subunit